MKKANNKNMFSLFSYIKKYKRNVIVGPVLKFLEALTDIFTPLLVAYILDKLVPTKNISLIVWVSIIGIMLNIFGLLFLHLGKLYQGSADAYRPNQ